MVVVVVVVMPVTHHRVGKTHCAQWRSYHRVATHRYSSPKPGFIPGQSAPPHKTLKCTPAIHNLFCLLHSLEWELKIQTATNSSLRTLNSYPPRSSGERQLLTGENVAEGVAGIPAHAHITTQRAALEKGLHDHFHLSEHILIRHLTTKINV